VNLRHSLAFALIGAACIFGCGNDSHSAAQSPSPANSTGNSAAANNGSAASAAATNPAEAAPPPAQTGGFDGQAAFDFTAKLVSFGPRPPASDAIHHTQDYLVEQLKSFGCDVDTDDFHASTPVGEVAMKNIIAKTPGESPREGLILLMTHYDTLRKESEEYHPSGPGDFVGAVDGGSSTGLMLEMARILCTTPQKPNAVWMAFVDGEEAFVNWNADNDNTYGSRQLAAKMAASSDLKRVKAVMLADMVGPQNLKLDHEANSTPWLIDLVWSTAARLGYQDEFPAQRANAISDDHLAFLNRKVASVDLIDLNNYPYWHTQQDTIDKVSPRSLAIVGHVMLASISELQRKFH
jgi:glutaminyl-peptide cyclotransferase